VIADAAATPRDAQVAANGPAGRTRPAARRVLRSALQALAGFVVMTLACAPIVVHHIHQHPSFSPVDEATYVDYLDKVGHGHFVIGTGERYGPYASNQVACRGILPTIRPKPAVCHHPSRGTPHRPRDSADIDPPTYYVVTSLAAHVLTGLGVTHELVTAGRLTGVLWGGAGLSVLYLLARRLGAGRLSSTVACAVALATSGVWTYWTYVTPHASDLLVGAAVSWGVLSWYRGRAPSWLLVVCGGVPVLVKATDATIVAAMVLFLLLSAVWRGSGVETEPLRVPRRLLAGAGLIIAGTGGASVLWLAVRAHYSLTSSSDFPQFDVSAFHLSWLINSIGTFTQSFQAELGLGVLITFWIYGSLVHYVSDRTQAQEYRTLALAAISVAMFGPWLYIVSSYVLIHQFVVIPVRYGLTLSPLALALGARNLRGRVGLAVACTYVAVLVLVAFYKVA